MLVKVITTVTVTRASSHSHNPNIPSILILRETSLDIHYDYKDASTTVVDKVMEVMEVMDTFTNTIDTLAPCTGTHIPQKEKRSGIESRIRV